MMTPAWIIEAGQHIGTTEIKGLRHNPKIVGWWKDIRRGGIKDDETPWCAAFVGACLEAVGIASSRFESARSYEKWGQPLDRPVYGCIVVFSRAGGGHVGFVVGVDPAGNLLVLGGNQADAVNIRAFSRARATAYRWPRGIPLDRLAAPPLLASVALSTSEA